MLVLGALCSEAQHYDRGYETIPSSPFIQKGTWSVGGSAKYTQHINDNFSLMLINGINSQGYNISVNPKLIYHFRENMGVSLIALKTADGKTIPGEPVRAYEAGF